MEKIQIKAKDNYLLSLHVYEADSPVGYVQIIHGMEEHQERYEKLALALNAIHYTVITSNMRGHGSNAPLLGYFAPKDGYKLVLEDQKDITHYIQNAYGCEKIILFGHSMGTIIARNLLQTETRNYEKVILSGYPCPNPMAGFGIFLASFIGTFKGFKKQSNILNQIALGGYAKSIKDAKTPYDWVCKDEISRQKYIDDPYCGHGFTISGYRDLFHLVKNMSMVKKYKISNTSLPLLLVSGKEDPCVGFEKGSTASLKELNKAGFLNIKTIEYDNMRHEILNETKGEDVISDIKDFLLNA